MTFNPLKVFRHRNHITEWDYYPDGTPYVAKTTSCRSPLCSRPECQKWAVEHFRRAIRYACRFGNVSFLTVTHLLNEDASHAYDFALKALRSIDPYIEVLAVIETHNSNLRHLHFIVRSVLPLDPTVVEPVVLNAVQPVANFGINYATEVNLLVSEADLPSGFVGDNTGEKRTAYGFAKYLTKGADSNLALHLALNNGHLFFRKSRGFWTTPVTRGRAQAAKAER